MIYLNNAATSARKPPCVVEAVARALTSGAGSSARGAAAADLDAARTVFEARCALAELFAFSHPERVVFFANATQALNTAIFGTVRPGDHVVATAYEHNSVLRPLALLERTRGARVSYVPVARSGAIALEDFDRLITPGTRLVAVSHASNLTGAVLPVAEVARMAHARGALVLVDAAQTAGALPVELDALGADLAAFTGHKALMGPQGTGGLAVAPQVEVEPLFCGGTGVQSARDRQPDTYPEHLEAGTANTPGLAGLAAGVRFVQEQGVEGIRAREEALRARFVSGVSAVPGVRVYGEGDGMGHVATVALNVGDADSARVADALAQRWGIATRAGLHCAPRAHEALGTRGQGAVRFSLGFYTTADEVDAAVRAVAAVARELA